MMSSDKAAVFTITFGVACAVLYVICTEVNLPLLTYHPVTGELDPLWTPMRNGPAMYWYGWMLTSLIGASALAFAATAIPERWLQRVILVGAFAAVAYLILYTLALFVYDRASIELAMLQSRWLSAVVAVVAAALVGGLVPAGWSERLWPGWVWVVPVGALAVLGYYLSPYFTR
jgi:hypothetical protein